MAHSLLRLVVLQRHLRDSKMATKAELRVFTCLLLCAFMVVSGAVAQQPDDNGPPVESAVPRAGVNGVTRPECIYCPRPEYSKEARKARVSGVVLLDVTVTTDGKIINPVVVKGPGSGLNEKALAQVKKWKMQPALSPGGKPVNCRVQIEITFRRNN
jgi:TonB family protein